MAIQEKKTWKYKVSSEETDKKSNSTSLVSKLKDSAYRNKLLRWVWLPFAMFTLGVALSQVGPTVLDLEMITDTDQETGSFIFTAMSIGYLLGSFVAGAIHGKINNNVLMTFVSLASGALTVVTPYCTDFVVMASLRGLVGLFLGCIDCTVNAEHMRIWGVDGQALLQLAHFSFAIGGVVSPIFSAPFLAPNGTESTLNKNFTSRPDLNSSLPATSDVHYAYAISGACLLLSGLPFLVMFIMFFRSKSSGQQADEDSKQREVPRGLHLLLVALLCAYYIMYTSLETNFTNFLATFLVNMYGDDFKQRAAYITTYFWAAFAAGRFTNIFTSKFLIAVRLLYVQYSILLAAVIGFLVSAIYHNVDGLTASTCLIGVGCSSVYPAGFSWTESELMKVTGRISGVILVGSSVGSIVVPYFMGYLLQHMSNLWFCYFLVGSAVCTILVFACLLAVNRLYVDRRYGTFQQQRDQAHTPASGAKEKPPKPI